MMTKSEALEWIQTSVPNENLCRHMIAVGAIMKKLAERFNCDPELWELTGILHDIDLGVTDDPARHGRIGAEWMEQKGMPGDMIQAVLCHAGHRECRTPLEYLLCAGDQISGLITACALVKGKKLANVTPETIRKRFKEKRFAAGADREAMKQCEYAGMTLQDLIKDALEAMQSVSEELNL
jgi:uncharacterized protein